MQEFSAPRKAITTHVKAYNNVSCVFDIANQLLTRHLSFPFRLLVMLMNELPRLHNSQSMVIC